MAGGLRMILRCVKAFPQGPNSANALIEYRFKEIGGIGCARVKSFCGYVDNFCSDQPRLLLGEPPPHAAPVADLLDRAAQPHRIERRFD